MDDKVSNGVGHKLPKDLKKVLTSDSDILAKWNSLTPLALNEWICWVISVKKLETRINHIKRVKCVGLVVGQVALIAKIKGSIVNRHLSPDVHREGLFIHMYFLYILQSYKNGKYYIGSTNNLERRIIEHNSGKTKSLKYLRPLKIVFQKEFLSNETDAKRLEKKLKKFKNRYIIEDIVRDQELRMGL